MTMLASQSCTPPPDRLRVQVVPTRDVFYAHFSALQSLYDRFPKCSIPPLTFHRDKHRESRRRTSRRPSSDAYAAIAFALVSTACVTNHSLVIDAASEAWSCKKDQVTATDLGDDNFRAAGCGKTENYYCERVYENAGQANQSSSTVCAPTKTVLEESAKANARNDACSEQCLGGGNDCSSSCNGDSDCRTACDKIAHACFDACTSPQ
ncbi:MAG: hypothetical protein ACRELY_14885 [Polyangiaceae bacterium]